MRVFTIVVLSASLSLGCFAGEEMKHGPDSEYQEGVPKGKVEQQPKWLSKIYPGTERDWWIYVPSQYDPATPANVMVFQDGGGPKDPKGEMRVPVVFDNLIHKKEMPVTIGIFINPGNLPPADTTEIPKSEARIKDEINAAVAAAVKKGKSKEEALADAEKSVSKTAPRQARQNRAFEYDSVGDRYARFLIEEILPEVEKKYNLTKDPAGRGICGQSSGGSCAFTVAWERPDVFGKVVSGIGSFTSLHGCNAYPDLIRKMEPKPIRIFMQDGDHDLDIYAGSWWHANNDMAAAFNWMGYDYKFLQGHDGHSGRQLGVNFPDAMRWLWRNEPVEGKRPAGADPRGINEVLIKGEGWRKVADATQEIEFAEADDDGSIVYGENSFVGNLFQVEMRRLGIDGSIKKVSTETGLAGAMKFGPDGKMYVPKADGIYILDKEGKESLYVALPKKASRQIAIDFKGNIYSCAGDSYAPNPITLIKSDKTVVEIKETVRVEDTWVSTGSKLTFTPDQGFLVSCDTLSWRLKSVRIEKDGGVADGEDFYALQSLEGQDASLAGQAVMDDKGRLYVASRNGIQIFDQGGRVIGILTLPERNHVTGMALGGANFDTLYAGTYKGLYARKLNARGVRSCKPPVTVKGPQM